MNVQIAQNEMQVLTLASTAIHRCHHRELRTEKLRTENREL